MVVLGVPIGDQAFIRARAAERRTKEDSYLAQLVEIDDVQAAWLLLSYTAVPRASHLLRTLTPSESEEYAHAHDAAVWKCFVRIVGEESGESDVLAHQVASLPGRLGGLGLRSAERTRETAYLAAWLDSFPVLGERLPEVAHQARAGIHSVLACTSCVWHKTLPSCTARAACQKSARGH